MLERYYGLASSVEIPDGVTSIGDEAFRDCDSLTSVTIPESVTCIGENVFRNCDCFILTIYGKAGSEAEGYAKENRVKFKVK
ncbi:MAG: leucine-rich repeat domain-containing protein [Thermoguttaceae bacterium]|nr:leucine-rich repeat domain-containing protein [Thermoguttaceae bacterium]